MSRKPECWLRLGSHSEKEYFLKTGHIFSGIIVNANLLAATPAATASLIVRMAGTGTRYWIDPYTYPFAQNIEWLKSYSKREKRRTIKRTFRTLAEEYGEPVLSALAEERELTPEDFSDQSVAREFARRVLTYQLERPARELEQDDSADLVTDAIPPPRLVAAPYFYESARTQLWRQTNLMLAREFCTVAEGANPHCVICVGHEILDAPRRIGALCEDWLSVPCSGYVLWLSDLDETELSSGRAQQLRRVVECLSASGKRTVYNAHGGFLSGLLSHFGMTGFSHGVGYGERRDVVPVLGGGVPWITYYFPPLHQKLHPAKIETMLPGLGVTSASTFHDVICDCEICRGVIAGDIDNFTEFGEVARKPENERAFPTKACLKKCKYHYLLARRDELKYIDSMPLEAVLRHLQAAYDTYADQAVLASTEYLAAWRTCLDDSSTDETA
ncbi:MAG: hypothetical protein ACOX9R_09370 [Armatimonadota bacterium]|jgi:hypothetical protein